MGAVKMGWGLAPGSHWVQVLCIFQSHWQELKSQPGSWLFCFPGRPLPPWLCPHPGSRQQVRETRGGGGRALRAASHGLSDLLTPTGLRPQALPTLVNKVALFKASPQ